MHPKTKPLVDVRRFRDSKLYRPLTRTLRVYNRRVVEGLAARGFDDFTPAFPQILSNLDLAGTRIGVLAARAGVTRQAAGQLVAEIERCGYVERRPAKDDARAVVVHHTPRGKRLMASIFELAAQIEQEFADAIGQEAFDQVRAGLAAIADVIDPHGTFGTEDERGGDG